MGEPVPSRRARLRAETAAEIKAIALRRMAAEGPSAISLRAIAREMGMTAGAIYSYYDTRDDLVTALVDDVYSSVADTLESARDRWPVDRPARRLIAWGTAYREWAMSRPDEFRLVYGEPVPGFKIPENGAAAEAEARLCVGITGLVEATRTWNASANGTRNGGGWRLTGDYQWSDFDPRLVDKIRSVFPAVPPGTLAATLRVWGRMHGLVSLEVYGHLRASTGDPERIFRAELVDLVGELGLSIADEPAD